MCGGAAAAHTTVTDASITKSNLGSCNDLGDDERVDCADNVGPVAKTTVTQPAASMGGSMGGGGGAAAFNKSAKNVFSKQSSHDNSSEFYDANDGLYEQEDLNLEVENQRME